MLERDVLCLGEFVQAHVGIGPTTSADFDAALGETGLIVNTHVVDMNRPGLHLLPQR